MMMFDELLALVRSKSDNGKPTRQQAYGALQILSGDMWGIGNLGFAGTDYSAVEKLQAESLARTVLMCAIFGDELNNDAFEADDA